MAITKTQRWLDLITFLVQRHFPVPVDELMDGVPAYRARWRAGDGTARATVHRMFERDKDELRAAGIPIETVEYTIEHGTEQATGYRLRRADFYLPYLRIVQRKTDEAVPASGGRGKRSVPASGAEGQGGTGSLDLEPDQAVLAVDALHRVAALPASPFARDARSALSKLTFDLDGDVVAEAPVLYADPPGPAGTREALELLAHALARRARVRFRYHGIARGEATDRDVAAYGLLYQHGQWYLIGHDALRGAIRVFRVGRMERPEAGDAAGYEIPADFDVASYARREAWELGEEEPVACDVRFEFPLALWAERNGKGERVEELPGGAAVRRFPVRQPEAFLRWLQTFLGDAVVLAPPALRAAQADLARRTVEAYGG